MVIKNLEKRELVQRKENPDDRRCAVISLTDGGRRLFESVCPERNRLVERETGAWTAAEQRQLLNLLGKFLEANASD